MRFIHVVYYYYLFSFILLSSVLFDEYVEKRWEECQPTYKGGCIGQDIPAGLRDTGPCLQTFLSQIEGRVAAGI